MEIDTLAVTGTYFPGIEFAQVIRGVIAPFLLIFLFLFLSALANGAEVACFALSARDRERLSKDTTGRKTLTLLENPEKLLATVWIAKIFSQAGVIVLTLLVAPSMLNSDLPPALEVLLLVFALTCLLLIPGEILPKIFAVKYPLGMIRWTSPLMSSLEVVFRPLSTLLIQSNTLINKRLKKKLQNISVNDISQAIEMSSDDETSGEKEILEGIVNFGNKNVSEIMRSRVDVVAVDLTSSFTTVLEVINNSNYSRIPVYSESFDEVKGILYIKDLLPYTEKGDSFRWQELLRLPFFVPETKRVADLLEDFQKNKIHMAIVVDEYGGSSGIVTMEDVLEEIIGDISDELDEDENFFTRLADNIFLFDGKTPLEKFSEAVGCEDDLFEDVQGGAGTLAGLLLEINGDLPALHHEIDYKGYHFTIESVTKRRIKQIKVEIR